MPLSTLLPKRKQNDLSAPASCPPASFNNPGVGTVVNIQSSPLANSEHQTEEDTLSTTSTIDYCYSEDGDEVEDDEVYSAPREQKKGKETLEYGNLSSMKSLSMSHKMSLSDRLHMKEWVASWRVLDKPSLETWIDVYGYYSKNSRRGGYGVILRDGHARPIIASAKFSKCGNNFFYQVLLGIKAGVALSKGRESSDLHVRCNSFVVPGLFDHAHFCTVSGCKENPGDICMMCRHYFEFMGCDCSLIVPLIIELRMNKLEISSAWGLAAHYLAKLEKKNGIR